MIITKALGLFTVQYQGKICMSSNLTQAIQEVVEND